MAKWVMFDAAFSDIGDLLSGIFFSVSALDVNLWRRIKVSNGDLTYGGLSWASNIRRKKSKDLRFFPPHSEMRHFYWTDFFEIRATTQSIQVVQKKIRPSYPAFIVHYGRHDKPTDGQKDNKKRAQRWDRKDWQVAIRFVGCHCFLKQDYSTVLLVIPCSS